MSAVARWDWPEQWPELFDLLMKELAGGTPAQVHGTMRVLAEFCQDVSDTQLPHIAPIILPHLLQVIVQSEVSDMTVFLPQPKLSISNRCTVSAPAVELCTSFPPWLGSATP